METSSRFSNGNTTARFWQKVTTGLFKRRLHRVLTISDVIFLDISTIYITNITSSPCDKVIHDLSTSSWPHEHADPDAWHLYFPAEEKFFHLKNADGSEKARFFASSAGWRGAPCIIKL
mmetsp:Transcript_12118/g.43655  ORF Transcript_12118/g.43655 Transcript_12118/m.43655 type:complete len:119 (-) Transcript_12118:79-435(-)